MRDLQCHCIPATAPCESLPGEATDVNQIKQLAAKEVA